MSMPGWYPDPGGANGRFRFWDGNSWSEQTTADPAGASTPVDPGHGGDTPRRKSDKGWLVALAVLLAVTLVAIGLFAYFGTRNPMDGPEATPDNNSSTPTVPEWNETSTPTPPPPSASGGTAVACPVSQATTNTPQVDGKLTADTLQVDQISGWSDDPLTLRFTYDSHWQTKTIYRTWLGEDWMSNIGVASLSNADGFTDPATSAEQIMECFASSGYYEGFTGRTDLLNEATTVDGHQAWRIESQIRVDDPVFPNVQGDVADIIVVDLGDGKDHLGLFLSCYTIGDSATQQQVMNAMSTLTVTG